MKGWLVAFALLIAQCGSANAGGSCRCQPDEPCWPTEENWVALNSSIEGNLVAVKPFAYPCHDTKFNEAECNIAKENAYNSSYRSSQPGALQWQDWEAWPAKEEQCYIETAKSVPCKQGRVSLFSAKAQTAQHIQTAVKFAARHNLKLVIKNTGHDFLGRSSAPNSLEIFTHELKNMSIIDDFVPSAPQGVNVTKGIKAVTLGAGVQLHEMYAYLGTKGVMVVGGASSTVGLAGGYIQGGGHSFLGWLYGMASDNALEFQVVLADGYLITANAYQNSDMFFALRGGGGGTFGVVVSVTVKAYSDDPAVYTVINYTSPAGPLWKGYDVLNQHIVHLNDKGGTGYFGIVPVTPDADPEHVSTFILTMMFVNQTDTKAIGEALSPFLSDLKNATGIDPAYDAVVFPTLSKMYTTLFTGSDTTGALLRASSRLVSRSFFESGDTSQMATALSTLEYRPADAIVGCIVSGGRVSENRDIESGINPAWRDTMVHLMIARFMSPDMTFNEQEAITNNITEREVPLLNSFEPGKMGAYQNEADANEPDFQESFWGTNYPRLLSIKEDRDPHDLFIVRKGVGSENWDDSGLCRV